MKTFLSFILAILTALTLVMLMASAQQVFGQVGALAPNIYPVFNNVNGITPVANGFVCTTVTGSATVLNPTYREDTNVTANTNPLRLNSSGRAVSGSTLVPIFLGPSQYRFALYAAGTGNTCNSVTMGTKIWEMDNVYDFGALLSAGLIQFTTLNNRQYCVTGATFGAKFTAAAALLPSTGGIVDCSNLQGAQTIASDVFTGQTKPLTVIWPTGTASSAVSLTVPSTMTLSFPQGGILSMASATTATINGGVQGTVSQHFAGAGAVNVVSHLVSNAPPQWWGAVGDHVTNDGPALQAWLSSLLAGYASGFIPAVRASCYYTTQALTLVMPDAGQAPKISGDGLDSAICGNVGAGNDVLTIDGNASNKNPISLSDFNVFGTTSSRFAIQFRSVQGMVVKGLFSDGAGTGCFLFNNDTVASWSGGGCSTNTGTHGLAQQIPYIGAQFESGANGIMFSGASFVGAIEATRTLATCTNATPIVCTTNAANPYVTGDIVRIAGVATNTAANGNWRITVNNTTQFQLTAPTSTGNGAGTGGTVARGVALYFKGSSYNDAFIGGSTDQSGIAAFIEATSGPHMFDTFDMSNPVGGTTDLSTAAPSTMINQGGGRGIIGQRIAVQGTDLSTFFSDTAGGQLGITRFPGTPTISPRSGVDTSENLTVAAFGPTGILKLGANAGDDGAGITSIVQITTGGTVIGQNVAGATGITVVISATTSVAAGSMSANPIVSGTTANVTLSAGNLASVLSGDVCYGGPDQNAGAVVWSFTANNGSVYLQIANVSAGNLTITTRTWRITCMRNQ